MFEEIIVIFMMLQIAFSASYLFDQRAKKIQEEEMRFVHQSKKVFRQDQLDE